MSEWRPLSTAPRQPQRIRTRRVGQERSHIVMWIGVFSGHLNLDEWEWQEIDEEDSDVTDTR
jgi:hypothetical protein